ncbi:MAG: DUF4287 domain-containing protein [Pleurocapsa sp. SU_196_0]|nr:DUF4287 domain-containing protein [Pleurocapsa sp. SU_196_0]
MTMLKSTKSPYSVHPRVHTMQNWMAQLEARTGRSFEAWVKLVKDDDAFSTEREQREWLRRAYGLGVTSAMHIAAAAQGYARTNARTPRISRMRTSGRERFFLGAIRNSVQCSRNSCASCVGSDRTCVSARCSRTSPCFARAFSPASCRRRRRGWG